MPQSSRKFVTEIGHFVIHFRLHYQFFILSAGYLFAALFVGALNTGTFLLQYFNMCILLFGTATAFNSYHDRDEGPIGGLKQPPPMHPWMRTASLLLQVLGLGLALFQGMLFAVLYLFSMILFWLYSTPRARWKGHPMKSLVAIGISTGSNSFWMGYIAAGGTDFKLEIIMVGLASALIFLSLYPVSQIYQMSEDRIRGDRTFAIAYGLKGIRVFFLGLFFPGILAAGLALMTNHTRLGLLFLVAGTVIGSVAWFFIRGLKGDPSEYSTVMHIKYLSSLGFTLFTLVSIILVHAYGY
jgi:4-hydroxybenzoate polyprenyltransferase